MTDDNTTNNINNSIAVLLSLDDEKTTSAYFDDLLNSWPLCDVVSALSGNMKIDQYQFAKKIKESRRLTFSKRPIRTIGTYFYSVSNGGTERVMSRLCYLWKQMGFEVVLITENLGQKDEYNFPEGIKRAILPGFQKSEGYNYRERAIALQNCIEENHIDVVVYHAWELKLILWDEMVIKALGAGFVLHCHNIFTKSFFDAQKDLKELVTPAAIADGIVTLSAVDKTFWRHFSANVYTVNNPFTGNVNEWKKSSCNGHGVLWIARISPEKRPFDALAIFQRVLKEVPDATLHIVGTAWEKRYERQFVKTIHNEGLNNHVIIHGYQKDVIPFYQDASVFLMTSEFEGYPMTLQECMASGLPIVMYELPHLTVTKDNPGIFSVKQDNILGAANAIIELLIDDAKRKQKGEESRKYFDFLMNYDYENTWNTIFNSIGEKHDMATSVEEREMMETLILHQHYGLSKKQKTMQYSERKTVRTAVRIVSLKDSIHEKGFFYTIKNRKKKQ